MFTATASVCGAGAWTTLEPGLELARFEAGQPGEGGDGAVTVLRADPAIWRPVLLCASELEVEGNLSSREWSERHGAAAVINGGMFATDYRTHVGLCVAGDHVNSGDVTEYQSVAAFSPRRPGLPPFRIFDLDDDGVTIAGIRADYGCVVQNLRLVKRPGENRWSPQPKRWSEAALGEDAEGRVLFIFSRTAHTMHQFNEILLALPLDLVCAQHLEGGPEAQLFVAAGGVEMQLTGSYETGFYEQDTNTTAHRIPVAIGLRRAVD